VFLLVAGLMSKIMNLIIDFFGQFLWGWISLDYWFMPFWIILAILCVFIIRLIYKSNIKAIKAACITIATLSLMICVYNMNAAHSKRTYITVYSDGVSAIVSVRKASTEVIVVSVDSPRAYSLTRGTLPTFTALLESRRNNEAAFGGITEKGVYDISGRFTLDVGENESILDIDGYRILFTRSTNNNASPADIIVASGFARNKREFNADIIAYVARTIPIEHEYEHSIYYEPLYLLLEEK